MAREPIGDDTSNSAVRGCCYSPHGIDAMALVIGKRLGTFEITALIGVGGMGEVYRARDTKLGRDVAIKVLPPELASDRERVLRFEREARILAALDHPKIGALYDFQREGEVPFLVLQLVEGETLEDRVARGSLPVAEAVSIFTQIAEALEAAHQAGIVHRDLKPSNIKLSTDGSVKVLDFGIARASEELVARSGSTPRDGTGSDAAAPTLTMAPRPPSLTGEGSFVGTPDFMSPEQARGRPVDRRTDIWAFGVCLYQTLVGRLPFEGDTLTDRITAVLRDEVDFATLPPEVPPRVRQLLRRCLEKDVHFRLRDIGEAWILLRSAFAEEGEEGEARRPTAGATPVIRFTVQLPAGHRLSTFSLPFAVSNDGQTIAMSSYREGIRRLLLRRLDELEPRELEGSDAADMPFFSPDGEWVGFFRSRQLQRVRSQGGSVQTLADSSARALAAVWTQDNEIVWGELGGGLKRVPAAGGAVETLTEPDRERGEQWHMPLSLRPGAKEILTLVSTGSGIRDRREQPNTHLELVSLESGERRRRLGDVRAPAHLLADGSLVFARGDGLFAVRGTAGGGSATDDPVRVLSGLETSLDEVISHCALSPAGTLVYARHQRREESSSVCWVSRQGERRTIPLPPNVYLGPRVSPDGEQVALVCNDASGMMQVFIYDLHRRALEQIPRHGKLGIVPVWHPSGLGLAFSSVPPPTMSFFSLEDGRVSLLPGFGDSEWPSSYSPDGRWLAFCRLRSADHVVIGVLDTESGEAEVFVDAHAHNFCPKFDSTGQLLAYVSDESGRWEVYLKPFRSRGRRFQVSIDGGSDPVFSVRSDELFYRCGDTVMAVKVERGDRLRVGKPEALFDFPFEGRVSLYAPSFDVHPDGDRFVVTNSVAESKGAAELVVVVNWHEELRRVLDSDPL